MHSIKWQFRFAILVAASSIFNLYSVGAQEAKVKTDSNFLNGVWLFDSGKRGPINA